MAYNIIRLKKLKSTVHTSNAENHNFRKNPNIKNVDYKKTSRNIYIVGDNNVDLQQQFLALKEKYKFKHTEGKSVKFYEFVISASPEFFKGKSKEQKEQYFKDNLAILKNDFLKVDDSILSAVIHNDESTPHMHVIAVPLIKDLEKTIARGRDKGKVIKGEFYSLSHERIFGKRKDFIKLQNTVHEKLSKKWQVERGLKNTGKKHEEVKEFYKKIDEFNDTAKTDEKLEKDLKQLTEFTQMNKVKQALKASEILDLLLKNIAKFKENFKLMLAIKKQNEDLEKENERLQKRLNDQAETREEIKQKAENEAEILASLVIKEEAEKLEEKIAKALTEQEKEITKNFDLTITKQQKELRTKQERIEELAAENKVLRDENIENKDKIDSLENENEQLNLAVEEAEKAKEQAEEKHEFLVNVIKSDENLTNEVLKQKDLYVAQVKQQEQQQEEEELKQQQTATKTTKNSKTYTY